jgi:hypothetical protein
VPRCTPATARDTVGRTAVKVEIVDPEEEVDVLPVVVVECVPSTLKG